MSFYSDDSVYPRSKSKLGLFFATSHVSRLASGLLIKPVFYFSLFRSLHLRQRVLRSFSEGGGYGGQVAVSPLVFPVPLDHGVRLSALVALSAFTGPRRIISHSH